MKNGEGGIRTRGRASPTQPFQDCSLGHSDTSPNQAARHKTNQSGLTNHPFCISISARQFHASLEWPNESTLFLAQFGVYYPARKSTIHRAGRYCCDPGNNGAIRTQNNLYLEFSENSMRFMRNVRLILFFGGVFEYA